ncbi:MAG TPA: hypothetical protein VJN93_16180 [Candidatus Acidoferrum sp.]|nr:hypothetical protein [Candidatus Acidoferrum sp.]
MEREANAAGSGSIKNAIRWGLLLAAVGTIGARLPRLAGEFRQWREAMGAGDDVAASGWHSVLSVDLVASLVVLAIGVAAFYFLRPRTKASG